MRPVAQLILGGVFIVLGLLAVPLSLWVQDTSWWAHGLWCSLALGPVFVVLRRVLSEGFRSILRNHFLMFTAAFTVYFIFGALLPVVGPSAEIDYAFAYYPVTAIDALRVDAINGIGFGVALLTGVLSRGKLVAGAVRHLSTLTSRFGPRIATLAFVVVGVSASVYVVSSDLGVREGQVSGVWRLLSRLTLVAVFVASAYRGRHERAMLAVATSLALLDATAGFLMLDKSGILLPLGALLAGLSLRFRSNRLLPAGVLGMAIVFVALGGVVSFGRARLPTDLSPNEALATRMAVVEEGLAFSRHQQSKPVYHPWARLSYLPAQTAGMHFYEAGNGGQAVRLIPWLFVPRFIAPEKPSITQVNADLHTKIRGFEGSSTGQGIFASAYYDAGWVGLVIISAVCGWILSQTSAMARVILARRDVVLLPLVLLGVYMAFRIDGHFLADYLGMFVFAVYLVLGGSLLATIALKRRP